MADTANKAGADAEGISSSIAAAAQKYESEHSPPKKNLAEIQVMTGEEDERNVVQVRVEYPFIHIGDAHQRDRAKYPLENHKW